MTDLPPGDIVWVYLSPVVGHEQNGRRPAVIISSHGHLSIADTLVTVTPVTSVDRGWSNHIRLQPSVLKRPSWAMTEQVRTISRERVASHAGRVDPETLARIRRWVVDFISD